MRLEIEQHAEASGGLVEIRLRGRLDSQTAPDLESRLEAALPAATRGMLLDCRQLEYISSAGIRLLFIAQRQLMAAGALFWLLSPQPAVAKVLDTVRILAPGAVIADRSEVEGLQ